MMRCAEAGFFDYCLALEDEQAISRIVGFFPSFGREKVLNVMNWARRDIEFARRKDDGVAREDAFMNLIRPRENVVRCGQVQAVSCDDPAAELEKRYHEIMRG